MLPEIRGLFLSQQGWLSVRTNFVGGYLYVVGRVVEDVHYELVAKPRVEC